MKNGVAGCAGLDVQDGTFRQEPGSGVCGQVQGCTVAVGNLDWVRSHSQTDAMTAGSPRSSSGSGIGTSIEPPNTSSGGTQDRRHHVSSDSNNSSSSSSMSSGSDDSSVDTSGRHDQQNEAGPSGGERASTSGRSEAEGAGVMTVYVGVNAKLAGVFEMRDQLRPDAAATIQGLQRHGIDTILLSGRELLASLGMLCCAVLCCAVLCRAALLFAVMCCAALSRSLLCCAVLYCNSRNHLSLWSAHEVCRQQVTPMHQVSVLLLLPPLLQFAVAMPAVSFARHRI